MSRRLHRTFKGLAMVMTGVVVGGLAGLTLGHALSLLGQDSATESPEIRRDLAAASGAARSAPPAQEAPGPGSRRRRIDAIRLPGAPGDALRVLFLGDSVLDGPVRRRVLEAIAAHRTVIGRGRRARSAARALEQTIPRTTDMVVLGLGTDVKVPRTFAENYARVIRRIRRRAPKATLVCLGAYLPRASARPVDRAVDRSCKAGTFIALTPAFNQSGSRQARIARAVTSMLRR